MIRVADYIAKSLADKGVRHIFLITGGGAMHLNDAFGHEPRLNYICNHHEQACAMAAEGYSRVTGNIGVINVTTGPGGINALNGVFGAWTDSIPMLIISGQVKRETCLATYNIPGLRQLGDQEADIIGMVKGITKYAMMVTDPATIRYHLERALHLATTGRPGPCWLDIPIDVQSASVDPSKLHGYSPDEDAPFYARDNLPALCGNILDRLQKAKRPVIMAGKGIRLANALDVFEHVIRRLGIPVVPAWTAIDIISCEDPLYCGLPGDVGTRAGNFTVQNSDLLLVLGTRLGLRQVSYNWRSFARQAYVIHVDVDPTEFKKPSLKINMPVFCDVRCFLDEFQHQLSDHSIAASQHADWLRWCRDRVAKYPAVTDRQRVVREGLINPYYFADELYKILCPSDVIVCSNGTANVIGFQTAQIKKGQRLFCNTGDASMGYGLPAALGAAVALGGQKRVICLEGDGSIQMNIQEFQTLALHRWPVKVFIFNNGGYLSIRQSQQAFFGRCTGESPASGVTFPDFVRVAKAYGLPARRISGDGFQRELAAALESDAPCICDVHLDPTQPVEPKLGSKVLTDGRIVSSSLEDMTPFLPRDEFRANMVIPEQVT